MTTVAKGPVFWTGLLAGSRFAGSGQRGDVGGRAQRVAVKPAAVPWARLVAGVKHVP